MAGCRMDISVPAFCKVLESGIMFVCMANSAKRQRRLLDEYVFPGFRPQPMMRGDFGDSKARVITFPGN
jgi:hypothetical protein